MLFSLDYVHSILFVIVYEDYAPIRFDMTCDERTNQLKYKNDLQGALDFCKNTEECKAVYLLECTEADFGYKQHVCSTIFHTECSPKKCAQYANHPYPNGCMYIKGKL